MIEQGMKAPDFTLEDKDGNQVSLSQFLGQKVILYFYPRDNTPGCTAQACGFRDAYDELQGKAAVIGRLCVIGAKIDEARLKALFGVA